MGIHKRSRKTTLGLFAGVLVMSFIVAPTGFAAGQVGDASSIADEIGTLRLDLGATDEFGLYDPSGAQIAAQTITDQACKLQLDSSTLLVGLEPLPARGDVGIFDDGIGVQVRGGGGGGGNGQPCGRADGPDEGLILTLEGTLADAEISRAEIDLEGKFNVTVDATLYLDGQMVADAGDCATCSKATGSLSDSGPDSRDGDNYRWVIDPGADMVADVLFDEIHFTVSADTPDGGFSLEGGADGTEPGPLGNALGGIGSSVFQIVDVDGIIACGQDTLELADPDAPQAVFTRGGDNTDEGKNTDNPCTQLIAYNLSSEVDLEGGEQTVTFEFDTDQFPTWFGVFTWTPEPAATPVPATQVDDGGGVAVDLGWCLGYGETITIPTPDGDSISYQRPIMPTGADWCLLRQTSTLLTDGQIQVTQEIYGETDPGFIRPK